MPRPTGYCLAMNRDEKRARAKGLPPELRNREERQMVYPSEPSGGTWVALNDAGASFALINWYSVSAKARNNVVSRGSVIPRLGGADSELLANRSLGSLPLCRINPFRLIGVFPARQEIIEWNWDLSYLSRRRHRWLTQQWISSGFDEATAQNVRNTTLQLAQAQRSVGTIDWLRRLHCSHSPQRGPFSTCMHREDAATVSYTEIEVLHGSIKMRHICGTPCNSHRGTLHETAVLPML
jgi:hypothetical protein